MAAGSRRGECSFGSDLGALAGYISGDWLVAAGTNRTGGQAAFGSKTRMSAKSRLGWCCLGVAKKTRPFASWNSKPQGRRFAARGRI